MLGASFNGRLHHGAWYLEAMVKSDNPRRRLFLDRILDGSRHVVDLADTDFGAVNGLRTALYREATRRDLQVKVQQAPDGRIIVAAYGGSLGTYAPDLDDVDTGQVTVTQDPAVGPKGPAPKSLPPATDLPPIEPSLSDPLFTNPGSFWVNRTWEPAAVWVNPFKDHPVGPQQCTWTPKNELWDLEDLSWLQDRRAAGTLYPWELRQGFCPPGTALSHTYTWTDPVTGRLHGEPFVWKQEEWLELALERCYCTCDMSRDGSLVDPGSRDHYSDPEGENSCPVWTAPDPEDDLATITAFMDPRGALVPGLMDDAEARVRQYAAMKRQKDQVRGAQ